MAIWTARVGSALSSIVLMCSARADFSGPYAVPTPFFLQSLSVNPTTISVGTWTLTTSGVTSPYANSYAFTDATQLVLNTGISLQHGAQPSLLVTFANTIAAEGVLFFDYSLTLHETGFYQFTNYGAYSLNGVSIQLSPGDGTVAVPVAAGDVFAFSAYAAESCIGCNPPFAGGTSMTITNFNAPVPETTVTSLVVFGLVAAAVLRKFRPA